MLFLLLFVLLKDSFWLLHRHFLPLVHWLSTLLRTTNAHHLCMQCQSKKISDSWKISRLITMIMKTKNTLQKIYQLDVTGLYLNYGVDLQIYNQPQSHFYSSYPYRLINCSYIVAILRVNWFWKIDSIVNPYATATNLSRSVRVTNNDNK